MEINVNKEELRILMNCVTITKESISNRVVMIPKEAKERLEKADLDDLWCKLLKEYEK